MHFVFSLLMAVAIPDRPVVEVFIPSFMDRNLNRAFGQARGIVDEAYAEIGVQVVWRSINRAPSGCAKKPGHRQIVLELLSGNPTDRNASALAFAKPYLEEGPCVTLLIDRLKVEVDRNPQSTGMLLGHVLAHEIGHVLQGIARHSETGLMKERWSEREIRDMWKGRLGFTEHDKESILGPLQVVATHPSN